MVYWRGTVGDHDNSRVAPHKPSPSPSDIVVRHIPSAIVVSPPPVFAAERMEIYNHFSRPSCACMRGLTLCMSVARFAAMIPDRNKKHYGQTKGT